MDKAIPILPCPDVRKQAEFYQALGFVVTGIYVSPSPYVALVRGTLDLHFYGSRRMVPEENASMCFLQVEDVDLLCDVFTAGIKAQFGKVPRSGTPRISKVRDLKSDRRFTLVDPGGNTFYVGTPVNEEEDNFFRTVANTEYAHDFALLYDLLYSKEDAEVAAKILPKLLRAKDGLSDVDRAKLLLIALDIRGSLELVEDREELTALLAEHAADEEWERIRRRFDDA